MKSGSAEKLVRAVETVAAGEIYISPLITSLAVQRFARRIDLSHGVDALSERELSVFALIAFMNKMAQRGMIADADLRLIYATDSVERSHLAHSQQSDRAIRTQIPQARDATPFPLAGGTRAVSSRSQVAAIGLSRLPSVGPFAPHHTCGNLTRLISRN